MSKSTITLVADLIRARRRQRGTRWRKADPGNQAVIVLAVLRHDQRLSDMAGGNNVSASTVRRWLQEVVELLAARAPRLDRALKKIARIGGCRGAAGRHSRPHPHPPPHRDGQPEELQRQTQGS
ncbi:hypothetical protein [Streptomyces chromofuscus]|uniref:hypothetical protein n=1 Tax=Streptomyces chromofuscus TaxID=42881 RepID=UPI001679E528|nr:hypothetical protein [Streptomyces chromofuscus]